MGKTARVRFFRIPFLILFRSASLNCGWACFNNLCQFFEVFELIFGSDFGVGLLVYLGHVSHKAALWPSFLGPCKVSPKQRKFFRFPLQMSKNIEELRQE